MDTDSELINGEKRKRETEMEHSEEEASIFVKNRKTGRSPLKQNQKKKDKIDVVLEALQQLIVDVHQIKLHQVKIKMRVRELNKENKKLMKENINIKRNNIKIRKKLEDTNTKLEHVEKGKRRNNAVTQHLKNKNKRKFTSSERKRYSDLINRIQESNDIGIHAVPELGEVFKEVNLIDSQCEFRERVEYTDETRLDLLSASDILVKCSEKLDIFTSTYEPTEFASKLLNKIQNSENESESYNWLSILEEARTIVPEVPQYAFLYGTFDPTKFPDPKQLKECAKQDLQENVEKKQLQRLDKVQNEEVGIEDTVNLLRTVLTNEYENSNSEPVSYFDFVIDSDSFASTIDNIFYTSFLVREGKAKLEIGEDGLPTLRPMRHRDLKALKTTGGANVQMISCITMEDWEVLRVKEGLVQKYKRKGRSA